jgi:CubicO group peptidase (beta-lactamase class C family)
MKAVPHGLVVAALLALAVTLGVAPRAAGEPVATDQLDRFLQQATSASHVPTTQVAVIQDGEVVFQKSYGTELPMDTPFGIGSMSKSFTGMAIAQLVGTGDVGLADRLSKHVSAPFADNITISELLTHTSGLRAWDISDIHSQSDKIYHYSNANYELLGKVIEQVSGFSYADYVQRFIFDPIGMNNSCATLRCSLDSGLVQSYRSWFGWQLPTQPIWRDDQVAMGYITASATDITKYLQTWLNDGLAPNGTRVFEPGMQEYLRSGAVPAGAERYYNSGWGFSDTTGQPVFAHSGSVQMFSSHMALLPNQNTGFVILMNSGDYLGGWLIGGLYSEIVNGTTAILLGDTPPVPSDSKYVLLHLVIDVIWLALIALSAVPLLTLRPWLRNRRAQPKPGFPVSGILFLPCAAIPWIIQAFFGDPIRILASYAPESLIVSILCSTLIIVGSIPRLVIRR